MLSDLPPVDPHPDLVAVQRPTPADMLTAAKVLGWYPDLPYLTPAVPATAGLTRRGGVMGGDD